MPKSAHRLNIRAKNGGDLFFPRGFGVKTHGIPEDIVEPPQPKIGVEWLWRPESGWKTDQTKRATGTWIQRGGGPTEDAAEAARKAQMDEFLTFIKKRGSITIPPKEKWINGPVPPEPAGGWAANPVKMKTVLRLSLSGLKWIVEPRYPERGDLIIPDGLLPEGVRMPPPPEPQQGKTFTYDPPSNRWKDNSAPPGEAQSDHDTSPEAIEERRALLTRALASRGVQGDMIGDIRVPDNWRTLDIDMPVPEPKEGVLWKWNGSHWAEHPRLQSRDDLHYPPGFHDKGKRIKKLPGRKQDVSYTLKVGPTGDGIEWVESKTDSDPQYNQEAQAPPRPQTRPQAQPKPQARPPVQPKPQPQPRPQPQPQAQPKPQPKPQHPVGLDPKFKRLDLHWPRGFNPLGKSITDPPAPQAGKVWVYNDFLKDWQEDETGKSTANLIKEFHELHQAQQESMAQKTGEVNDPTSQHPTGREKISLSGRNYFIDYDTSARARRKAVFTDPESTETLTDMENELLESIGITDDTRKSVAVYLDDFFNALPHCQSTTQMMTNRRCEISYYVMWSVLLKARQDVNRKIDEARTSQMPDKDVYQYEARLAAMTAVSGTGKFNADDQSHREHEEIKTILERIEENLKGARVDITDIKVKKQSGGGLREMERLFRRYVE